MDGIENVMHEAKCSSTEALKSFPVHYGAWGGDFEKTL